MLNPIELDDGKFYVGHPQISWQNSHGKTWRFSLTPIRMEKSSTPHGKSPFSHSFPCYSLHVHPLLTFLFGDSGVSAKISVRICQLTKNRSSWAGDWYTIGIIIIIIIIINDLLINTINWLIMVEGPVIDGQFTNWPVMGWWFFLSRWLVSHWLFCFSSINPWDHSMAQHGLAPQHRYDPIELRQLMVINYSNGWISIFYWFYVIIIKVKINLINFNL